ncbi:anti-sigma factor RsbA family regulatory protein [Spirilliplanes yamanashiensis]|uniref:Anti-sigma regulatory factor n=1 Tax=Spirilliplanes yamanashiensis TaxID=42233 RepID=A0A8J4DGA9_9ACTN|nr:anti-sigma factor RsbA family regulatory protein [Spirilliplanes yamanashiensis]MDP9820149.1 anti-sigma regulatory factor (Ser/Thr protein kinase) [Spirilliplanes yamanashiensis]GIJ01031.1 anti-sigma regulatory factor [Spirilliplanes yamanashiensis]
MSSSTAPLDHFAFPYDSDEQYVTTLVAHVGAALGRGDGVVVATSPRRVGLLREALGDAAADVLFLPDHEWYTAPGRTIAGWVRVLAASAARGHTFTRLVGEVRFGEPDAHRRWIRYESAVNAALAGAAADLLCPYDTRTLPPDVLTSSYRTHPCLHDGTPRPSPRYTPPQALLREIPEPPIAAPGPPTVRLPVDATVAGLRETLRTRAQREGWLGEQRLEELVLALSEITTNGVRHGGGLRGLSVWVTDRSVVCEVTDGGGAPLDPLAGYLPPRRGAIGGMGLWLVRQVCDAVEIVAAGGVTRVRFAVDR